MDLELKMVCNECGEEVDSAPDIRSGSIRIIVYPCVYCLNKATDAAEEKGREKGYDEGHDDATREAQRDAVSNT